MFKLIGRLLVVLAFSYAASVSAAPVVVDGREWLQPVDFLNHSWDSVSGICNSSTGICNGSLDNFDLTGYTWASVNDVNALFNHFITNAINPLGPGPSEFFEGAAAGGRAIFEGGFIPSGASAESGWISGWVRDVPPCVPATICQAYSPGVDYYDGSPINPALQQSHWATYWVMDRDEAARGNGIWLFRAVPHEAVPLPASLSLFLALGLIGMVYIGRSRRKLA